MRERLFTLLALVALLLSAAVLPAPTALAQEEAPAPSIPMTSMIEVAEPPAAFNLVQLVLDFDPGTGVPLHHHGGPVLVMIMDGELTSTVEGEEKIYSAGDQWSLADGQQHSVINATDNTVRVAVSVVLPVDEPLTTFADPDDSAGFTVVQRTVQEVTDAPSPMTLMQAIVDFPPSAVMPAHVHGSAALASVLSGTLTLYEDGESFTYSAGEFWYEPANHEHYGVNEGEEDVRVLVTWTLAEGAAPTTFLEQAEGGQEGEEVELNLVTARVNVDLVRPGRLLMDARDNYWIYDSPLIDGSNLAVNPLDGTLAALGACGMFMYEAVGKEQHIPVNHLSTVVTGELDGRGGAGAPVSPRLRAFHVTMNVEGPSVEQAASMTEAFQTRCPIYTTLSLSAPIHVTNVVMGMAQETISTEADPIVDYDAMDELEPQMGKPTAYGRMVDTGRSMMWARNNYWILDSVPPIHGPNLEVNPLDMFVGALPACGVMIYEAVAQEQGIALNAINATVEADLDPRGGMAGATVNPRIRAFRVTMNVDGPTADEAAMLADAFSRRCPIYTTFERSAPIEVTNVMMGDGN